MKNREYDEIWTIIPEHTPRIIRKCPRCERTRFYSSDKFRLNANQKKLDAWLIYKCVGCDYTYNITILRRKTVSQINKELLCKYRDNDRELVKFHAFDITTFNNSLKIDWDIKFQIESTVTNVEETQPLTVKKICIQSKYNLKFPVLSLLREKLKLSRTKLDKLHAMDQLILLDRKGANQKLKAPISQVSEIIFNKIYDGFVA